MPVRDISRTKNLSFRLTAADYDKLDALAAEAGMTKSAMATALFEELLPTIKGVRRRLQIIREDSNGKVR
jgi:hypothetical protein